MPREGVKMLENEKNNTVTLSLMSEEAQWFFDNICEIRLEGKISIIHENGVTEAVITDPAELHDWIKRKKMNYEEVRKIKAEDIKKYPTPKYEPGILFEVYAHYGVNPKDPRRKKYIVLGDKSGRSPYFFLFGGEIDLKKRTKVIFHYDPGYEYFFREILEED
jgi:hypothetical protein